ncbi:hypothetical protein FACS1894199_00110 [Bacteroidia bacterium]|nr:hypothetical protein FACS1894199_00110 [Bacteroidia bacterium]
MGKYILYTFQLVLTIVLTVELCAQEAVHPIYKEGFYPNKKLRYKGMFIGKEPVGEVTHYTPEGKLKAVMKHASDTTDAILYSKDEKHSTSGRYIRRKKTGAWEYRFGERLLMKEEYKADLLDGKSIRYDNQGNVAEIKTWKEGNLHGDWTLCYPDGTIRCAASYKEGKLEGTLKSYSHDGRLSVEGTYKNNLKDGTWRYYTPDGKLKDEIHYTNGVASNRKEIEMKENEEVNRILRNSRNIPDPANFLNDPEVYMRYSE